MIKTILIIGAAVLLWLVVIHALRWTANSFKGKKLGKVAKGAYLTILELTPKLLHRLAGEVS